MLARKWRPQFFEDLVGQDTIIRVLRNALLENRLAHAYLFSGPRGVGKTSAARILAKALNCENGPTPTPCGNCTSCQAVRDGSFMDVIEIDGASNNSVDDIRDLREKVRYAPSGSRYKLYIIDEAHMLSTAAFNALLKTLEEPPPHVIFVLATTAANKIIATVLSRCQHLPFKRVPSAQIKERLMVISKAEGFNITSEALDLIARAADGGMRDCLTLLDKIASFTTDITASAVRDLLGIADLSNVSAIANAIVTGDRVQILRIIDTLYEGGVDLRGVASELTVFLRDALVQCVHNAPTTATTGLSTTVDVETLTVILNELIKAHATIKTFFSPRIALEMTLIKLSLLGSLKGVEGVMADLLQRARQLGPLPALPSAGQQKTIISAPISVPKAPEPTPPPPPATAAASDKDTGPNDVLLSLIPSEQTPPPEIPAEPPPMPPSKPVDIGQDIPQPTQPVSGNNLWQALIEAVTNVSDPLGGRLNEATFDITEDNLNVYFSGGKFKVHGEAAKKGKTTIETVAKQLTGKKYKVHVKEGSPDGASVPETTAVTVQDAPLPPVRDLKAEAMADPVIKEALDTFGGYIVSIKPIDK